MKSTYLFLILATPLFYFACSPKVAEETKEEVVTKPIKEEPKGPCTTLSQLSPSKKDEAETAYVLYRDFYKTKEFEKALPLWKKAFALAPAANGRIKYQFDDGVGIYKGLIEKETDEATKKAYVDEIMKIYDKRTECIGDEGYSLGRKAFDNYYYFSAYSSEDETFKTFKQAMDLKGEKADYFVINPFAALLSDRVLDERISHEEGRKYAKRIFAAVEYGKANCKKDCEAWDIVNDYAPAKMENLEGVKGFFDCDYFSNKYHALYLSNPTDCETINMAYGRMLWGQCEKTDPLVTEVKNARQANCYTPPPPKESTLRQAYDAYTEGRYNEAITLFDAFVRKTTDPEKKAKYTLLIAKIYYGDIKNFPKSRKKALEAASFRANWGEPYILIGKLYASSGPLCGPGRGWDSQIVTWPAIDKFEYAKKIDPASAQEASKWISQYKQYMPTKEDIFIRSLKAGSTYKVGCWINENTKIRTAN